MTSYNKDCCQVCKKKKNYEILDLCYLCYHGDFGEYKIDYFDRYAKKCLEYRGTKIQMSSYIGDKKSKVIMRMHCIKPEMVDFGDEKLYIKNNPWKLSIHNDFQKFHRFCIFCGKSNYTDKEWCKLITNDYGPLYCKYCNEIGRNYPIEFTDIYTNYDKRRKFDAVFIANVEDFDSYMPFEKKKINIKRLKIPKKYEIVFKELSRYTPIIAKRKANFIYYNYLKENYKNIFHIPFNKISTLLETTKKNDIYVKLLNKFICLCDDKITDIRIYYSIK
jgi:hypothetical protein